MKLRDVVFADRVRRVDNPASTSGTVKSQEEGDDFVAPILAPRNQPMTAELLRRQREEELREKYCYPAPKTGELL